MPGDLVGDLVPLEHVLERRDRHAELLGRAQHLQDLVLAVRVAVDLALALEDLRDGLELQVGLGRDRVRALDRGRLPVLLPAGGDSPARPGRRRGSTRRRPSASAGSAGCGLRQLDCFGFSPSANLMPSGAPAKKRSSGPPPHRHLTIWFWPPIALAEPWSTLAVVVPPASSRYTATSKGFITSWIRTSAVTLCVPSLTSPSTAVCECASMMPGRHVLAAAVHLDGAGREPSGSFRPRRPFRPRPAGRTPRGSRRPPASRWSRRAR